MDVNLFFMAVCKNDVRRVKRLLTKPGFDVNYVNQYKENALTIAVGRGYKQMVECLIENGILINNRNTMVAPLLKAIKCNRPEMVGLLIDLGASLEDGWYCNMKISPLVAAVRGLKFKIIKLMIEKGANVLAKDSDRNRTALHHLADIPNLTGKDKSHTTKRLKVAKLLLEMKVELDAVDSEFRTALDGAVINCEELCSLFIERGAQVRIRLGNGSYRDYLFDVVNLNNPELVRMCLERGSDFSAPLLLDGNTTTPYHFALKKSTPEVVKVFWQFGCPVDLPPVASGVRPTESAPILVSSSNHRIVFQAQLDFIQGVKANDPNLVFTAIKKGAEPKGTSELLSPLHHLAFRDGDYKIARTLLEHGVPVNKLAGFPKKTCLYLAIFTNNVNMMKEILMFGGSFTVEDLEMGRDFGSDEIRDILHEIADAFQFTRIGSSKVLTQLKKCLNSSNKDMAKVLMNCVDWRGRSLLNLALSKGHYKLADKLMKLRIKNL